MILALYDIHFLIHDFILLRLGSYHKFLNQRAVCTSHELPPKLDYSK